MTAKDLAEAIQRLPEEQQNLEICYPYVNQIITVDEVDFVEGPGLICTKDGAAYPKAVITVS